MQDIFSVNRIETSEAYNTTALSVLYNSEHINGK